jgi:hypothetical protein
MDWGQAFKIANTIALLGWLALILMPRKDWLLFGLRRCLITGLCILYASVIFLFASDVEGGGFSTLPQVQALFRSDPVAFAAWVHYLAFDMFVGLWIAEQADQKKIHRLVQAPILIATFLLGPLGLLLFYILEWFYGSKK